MASPAARRQRDIQKRVAKADKVRQKPEHAMQAGARTYPSPPFPKQRQSNPGSESELDPPPLFDGPFYLGSRKLEKKVALITGGDSGIGRAVAILFAGKGADVAISYLSEHKDARITKKKVEAEGKRCILLAGDVSSQKFCDKAVGQTIKAFGQLDVLVNNAAFQIHTSQFEDLTAKHFDETLKTNLYGYFYMAQAAVKQMKPGAAIINTGSVTGLLGSEALLDYSMTKGGIHAFTRSLSSHLVPRGIRVNAVAADKRLAVRTEDHPLAYGSFEGTIPKGEYGGGTVMLWDRGVWEPKGEPHAGLKKGHLAFELHGERLKGGWDLVRMRGDGKRENWLLIKEADPAAAPGSDGAFLEGMASSVTTGRSMEEIAGAASPENRHKPHAHAAATLKRLMDRYPDVQLATLADQAPEGDRWVHEIKLDGYRLLGLAAGGTARLRTRNGKDWTESFPAVASALARLRIDSAVLDMEAVLLDPQGKSSFQALQAALGEGGHPERIVAYCFDLLHLDGSDLTRLPLSERKDQLKALLAKSDQSVLRYSEHFAVEGADVYQQACADGLEGIISKRIDSPYVAGRQKTWLKAKCSLRQEFIIIGYSSAKSGGRALGALYLGYKKDGALRYAGKVGTGFTMKSALELAERLHKIESAKAILTRDETKGMGAGEWRSVHWVKPKLLCEVSFTEWTADGRIRHPSFQGLRGDKDANDVKHEKPVPAISVTRMSEAAKPVALVAAGITISHPDRIISEAGRITKGELAEYHAAVAPLMLPSITRHPLSLVRCPSGIDGKQCFFQRSPGRGLGKDVHSFDFRHKGKRYEYLYIEDEKGLLEIIQMGAIEIHPWGASIDAIDYPDRLIFDLDPAPDVPFDALKLAAIDLRQRLKKRGLDCGLKSTGGKGLHVTVALAGKDQWAAVKTFGAAVAEEMVSAAPEAYVATMSKAKRSGKIFIDYFRNDYTATAIADYGVRARPGAPVAVPLEWDELKGLKSASAFTMKDVLKRLKKRKPPVRSKGQVLPS